MRSRKKRGNPATSDILYRDAEREFLLAMEHYKRLRRRPFPTWHEVLAVLHALGYRQVAGRRRLPEYPTPAN